MRGSIPWHMSRGAVRLGLVLQSATGVVAKTISVAASYRRAFTVSRALRLPR